MERTVDIFIWEGKIRAEDRLASFDFTIEPGYLFTIGVPLTSNKCRIFKEEKFKKFKHSFKGKYYITLTEEWHRDLLYITNDYDDHLVCNIVTNWNYDNEVNSEYKETIILDMDKMEAHTKNETAHFEMIIKDEQEENNYFYIDRNFMKHYPGYI